MELGKNGQTVYDKQILKHTSTSYSLKTHSSTRITQIMRKQTLEVMFSIIMQLRIHVTDTES